MSAVATLPKQKKHTLHSQGTLETLRAWSDYFETDLTTRVVYKSYRQWADWFIEGSMSIPVEIQQGCVTVRSLVTLPEELEPERAKKWALRLMSHPHEQKGEA